MAAVDEEEPSPGGGVAGGAAAVPPAEAQPQGADLASTGGPQPEPAATTEAAEEPHELQLAVREQPPLVAGDRVVIKGMVEKEKLNGTGGVLVEMTGDRWQVRLDGKGRWLLKTVHLEKVETTSVNFRNQKVCIVGTWDNFKEPHEMTWDSVCQCFHHEIKLGSDKEESFQILLGGDYKRCLHPDKPDANPYSAYNLLGPDDNGHTKNWTIGKHGADEAAVGARYRVSLHLLDDGHPKKVHWTRIDGDAAPPKEVAVAPSAERGTVESAPNSKAPVATPAPTAAAEADAIVPSLPRYKSVCIVGEFNDWKSPVPMDWEESRRLYHYRIKLGYAKQESFQMLVDGEWTKCVHPDEADGCFHMGSIVCGPDDDGHGKNWTIGLHPFDRPARGAEYEVRLHLADDGRPSTVDWQLLDKAGNPLPVPEPEPLKLPEHKGMSIIGGWNDWKAQDMKFDPDRRCYHIVIEVGPEGQESFQIWLDRESKKCLHPFREDGNPFTQNKLCGPDNKGHGKNWTIGLADLERADPGVRFEVRLWLTADGRARFVDWMRIRPGVVGRTTAR